MRLRRADAERERGGVPGLHTQTTAAEPGDEADIAPRARGLKPRYTWLAIRSYRRAGAVAIAWSWRGEEPPPPWRCAAARHRRRFCWPPAAPAAIGAHRGDRSAAGEPVAIALMRARRRRRQRRHDRPRLHRPSAAASTIPRIASLAELPPELRSGLPALRLRRLDLLGHAGQPAADRQRPADARGRIARPRRHARADQAQAPRCSSSAASASEIGL